MESELLEVIKNLLSNFNYEYGEYTGVLKYPYMVGEYNENTYQFENNITGGEFILTCFHRGNELDLINIKEEIKKIFADYRSETESGTIWISYNNKQFIRSGEAELKKMEIYLDTKTLEGGK